MKPCTFFISELRSLYQAEQQSLQTIARMAELASSDKLSDLFSARLPTIQQHLQRIEQVFALVEAPPQAKKSEAMEGLIAETNTVINESANTPQFDAALISCAQKGTHYKIACYGCLCSWSYVMNLQPILELLKVNLQECKAFNVALSEIAQNEINIDAFSLTP